MMTTATHPKTRHGCEPKRFTYETTSPVGNYATPRLDDHGLPDARSATIDFVMGEFVNITVRYADGTVDRYEATELSLSLVGYPVCPTGEHQRP